MAMAGVMFFSLFPEISATSCSVLDHHFNSLANLRPAPSALPSGRSVVGVATGNMGVDREGVVVRGLEREFSFKAISNTYLLGSKE